MQWTQLKKVTHTWWACVRACVRACEFKTEIHIAHTEIRARATANVPRRRTNVDQHIAAVCDGAHNAVQHRGDIQVLQVVFMGASMLDQFALVGR